MVKSFNTALAFIVISFSSSSRADDVVRILVKDLHPTQMSVGLLEVRRKAKKIANFNKSERDSFLVKNPVPVVVGPSGDLFIIDHHHLSRAVLEAGHKHVYIKKVGDFSSLNETEFWNLMKTKGYVYLFDDKDKAITPKELPSQVKDMQDDPYRSLAGVVRKCGGYTKDFTPFAEFKWASFFRSRLKFENSKKGLKKILPQAIQLAQGKDAEGLPGYHSTVQVIKDCVLSPD
ncbi:MAG: ParB-like protein [Bdellovibrio sp.]